MAIAGVCHVTHTYDSAVGVIVFVAGLSEIHAGPCPRGPRRRARFRCNLPWVLSNVDRDVFRGFAATYFVSSGHRDVGRGDRRASKRSPSAAPLVSSKGPSRTHQGHIGRNHSCSWNWHSRLFIRKRATRLASVLH